MSPHPIELLHPTDPPGPRAFRLVLLVIVTALFVGAVVWATDPGRTRALPDATRTGSNERTS